MEYSQIELSYLRGLGMSAALIVAIGAQNAFVLRAGLRREHVLAVVLVCAFSDALLITLGVLGVGTLVQGSPVLLVVARYGGAAFLIGYGALAARRAWRGSSLTPADAAPSSLREALGTCLALTYLNPHCWLDTVVVLGAVAGQLPAPQRTAFGLGATAASFVWFFALGYGARLLRGVFARPAAWRWLDGAIALVMWSIAASLLRA